MSHGTKKRGKGGAGAEEWIVHLVIFSVTAPVCGPDLFVLGSLDLILGSSLDSEDSGSRSHEQPFAASSLAHARTFISDPVGGAAMERGHQRHLSLGVSVLQSKRSLISDVFRFGLPPAASPRQAQSLQSLSSFGLSLNTANDQ